MVNPRLHLKSCSQWLWSVNIVPASATGAVLLGCCIGVSKNSVLNRARQGLHLRLTYSNSLATGIPSGSHREPPLGPPLGGRMPRASDLARSPLYFVPFSVPLSYHCPCILEMAYRATLKDECRGEEGLYPLKLPSFVWKRQERGPKWTKAKQPVVRKAPCELNK